MDAQPLAEKYQYLIMRKSTIDNISGFGTFFNQRKKHLTRL
jgi:hypothetical protein